MTNKHLIYLLIIISGLLQACSQNIFFESSLDIPNSIWGSDKEAVFDFEITDSLQVYDLLITISNTNDYRHSNLWLFVRTKASSGPIASDTLEYVLADEKGKWFGKKNGDVWFNQLMYKSKIRFPKTGKYTIEIIQGMRDVKLKGIKQVGIEINTTE
jgi:gliding motility-associated lipoprotein GldH